MPSASSEKRPVYTDPIPTKFLREDFEVITEAEQKTGLNRSEIIRRSVRLLKRQKEMVRGYDFIVGLTT